MAEHTTRAPDVITTETDLSARQTSGPTGVPAGVVGTAKKGPAFVPLTVATNDEFTQVFGGVDPKSPATYAASQFLQHRDALTFCRVLGAGFMESTSDIQTFQNKGQAKNAGFVVTGTVARDDTAGRHNGAVQFITALHTTTTNEAYGMPLFTDNSSYASTSVNLIRGMVLLASGTRLMVLGPDEPATGTLASQDDVATLSSNKFKLVLSSSAGAGFATTDGKAGIKVFTASLNPSDSDYFGKLLNQDPEKFSEAQHLLYADFSVDAEVATATTVAVVSGSAATSNTSGDTSMLFRDAFGHFDTRYTSPKTTWFISQPFGNTEYDLFYVEAIDDGAYANSLYKISVSNLKVSADAKNPYGTFAILVRAFDDTDANPVILEQFPNCSLDPNAENYVARVIGDRKVFFNFDSENINERRLVSSGKYANQSRYVRVVMNEQVERGLIPQSSLPFGFRGIEVLKTSDDLSDTGTRTKRLAGFVLSSGLTGSIVPPLPYRFKVTKGDISTSGFAGNPGNTEIVNANYYWGVKTERNNDPLDSNVSSDKNACVKAYTKFLGIKKLDVLVTGSGADTFNENKFTLARVAFSQAAVSELTGTVADHMREVAYVRNGKPNPTNYTVSDGVLASRITLATLLAQTSSVEFNRFVDFAKFTNIMYGGFDGVNILDANAARLNDRSVSLDSGGGAESTFLSPGLAVNCAGATVKNNGVFSYRSAAEIMTDPSNVNINLLAVPGIKETYVTDYAAQKAREYKMALYVMDIPTYDDSGARMYDDSTTKPSVDKTAQSFQARVIDNNYVATYFPDVVVDDSINRRRVKVAASVAALAALGFNDRVAYPWYAPAGFNRAALDFVSNTSIRLNKPDQETLADARINPIATFPGKKFAIFGQKTLQQANSALNRVNVRRLVLEVKRQVSDIALNMTFEQNTPEVRSKFVKDANTRLGIIQANSGIETFEVIMDARNNTEEDVQANRVRGRIELFPTKVFERIVVDFVITNSGVEFQ